ncbi:MAG: NAD-dependent epimerase/dehydratase family protein [Candidatus Omnitrophota bacterium]|jgi:nucleoside-diphosphate-sugar epimerase
MNESIAILGATSHIAKGLIYNFIKTGKNRLFLFARFPERVNSFLKENNLKGAVSIKGIKDFPAHKYDVIINCIGIGTPNRLKDDLLSIFRLSEDFDNLVISYLDRHPGARCINFSSGAVYGSFTEKTGRDSCRKLRVNDIRPQDYYGIAKINSEAKHRCRKNLNIVDIRIFSYFSRFIDLNAGYFLTEALKSIKEGKKLLIDPCDFIRDYLNPQDLFSLVSLIIKKKPFNGALDAYSAKPVTKFKLLDFFAREYGLEYIIDNKNRFNCPTGKKDIYCSLSRKAAGLGYKPEFSSLDTVKTESEFLL